ncbi:MAG: AAA domain-containing protein [Nocardioides sp.]|uniref:AAA domain-containing protein n=1 Tax=Nocardioides sp. TaxID=35761 RepID=UPI003D6B66D0
MIDPRKFLVMTREKGTTLWRDKTSEVRSFEVTGNRVRITYRSDKTYPYSQANAIIVKPTVIPVPEDSQLLIRGEMWTGIDTVFEFGGPTGSLRKVFRTQGSKDTCYSYPAADVVMAADVTSTSRQAGDALRYLRAIAETMDADDPIVRPYRSMAVHPHSALARYLAGEFGPPRSRDQPLVFPFRSNLSQREAVNKALTHSISVIEGPPGTGKTETILNVIANIVTYGLGSVGVVSFNNSAVDNVRDKLGEQGFGHLVANLGRKEKREAFFAAQSERNEVAQDFVRTAPAAPDPEQLAELERRMHRLLEADRDRAQARALLIEYKLEQKHFDQHMQVDTLPDVSKLPLLRRSAETIIDLLLETRGAPRRGLLNRVRRYFRFGRLHGLDPGDSEVVLALQSQFYQKRISELTDRIATIERQLEGRRFDDLVGEYQQVSQESFAAAVAKLSEGEPRTYTPQTYRSASRFSHFLRDYPVILSTCHSIPTSLAPGHLLDYLIIDEASQADLLTATLAMASCRNLVVVGDLKQLAPFSKAGEGVAPPEVDAYDYAKHSILSSLLSLFPATLPRTLLREHYRCHPMIIGFCNRAFYDGQLIPFTTSDDRAEPAMLVHPTPPGNHMRARSNQREIDVIKEEVLKEHLPGVAAADIAVAAAFRQQVGMAADQLDDEIAMADTVHRLQGRQKPMVVLTTVLSENRNGGFARKFVDDPRLVNVAVSRAIDHFVLVTNYDELPRTRYLRDLIGYIKYQRPGEANPESTVISIFDLLYKEYSTRLESLAARLRPDARYKSEEITRVTLGDILKEGGNTHLDLEAQILLRNLVPDPSSLTPDQAAFVRRTSSVDFVIYNRVTRRPVLVIEVDGVSFHSDARQLARDRLKDAILKHVGVPLLRLPTNGSREWGRIRQALREADA